MKQYWLVDVPVRINIWIRPEMQRQQFEVIRKAKPKTIFFISDGGRNEKEKLLIQESRRIVDNIDWECDIYKIFEEKNNGMYAMGEKAWSYIFQLVDRCILLEDDVIPSVSFFQYCAVLLEKYKDDYRVHMINGMNHLGIYESCDSDYFFSHEGSIWGFAIWKRTYDLYNNFKVSSCQRNVYTYSCLEEIASKDIKAKKILRLWKGYSSNDLFENHPPGDEFFLSFIEFLNYQMMIVPKKNMISNVGCDSSSAHASELKLMPKAIQRLFNMKTYEMNFPMQHPKFMIQDEIYARKVRRIMGTGHPMVRVYRLINSIVRRLIFLSNKSKIDLFMRKFHRKIEK